MDNQNKTTVVRGIKIGRSSIVIEPNFMMSVLESTLFITLFYFPIVQSWQALVNVSITILNVSLISIILHEAGHAITYLILNPKKEFSIGLDSEGGYTNMEIGPVRGMLWVILAGPLVNLVLVILGLLIASGDAYYRSLESHSFVVSLVIFNMYSLYCARPSNKGSDGERVVDFFKEVIRLAKESATKNQQ